LLSNQDLKENLGLNQFDLTIAKEVNAQNGHHSTSPNSIKDLKSFQVIQRQLSRYEYNDYEPIWSIIVVLLFLLTGVLSLFRSFSYIGQSINPIEVTSELLITKEKKKNYTRYCKKRSRKAQVSNIRKKASLMSAVHGFSPSNTPSENKESQKTEVSKENLEIGSPKNMEIWDVYENVARLSPPLTTNPLLTSKKSVSNGLCQEKDLTVNNETVPSVNLGDELKQTEPSLEEGYIDEENNIEY
jgi:hypothetical protein